MNEHYLKYRVELFSRRGEKDIKHNQQSWQMRSILNIRIHPKFLATRQIIKNLLEYQYKWFNNGIIAPHPFRCILVNPKNIEYVPVPHLLNHYNLHHFGSWVIDGEWHTWPVSNKKWHHPFGKKPPAKLKFEKWVFYQSLRQSLLNDVDWTDTEHYRWAIEDTDRDHDWLLDDFRKTQQVYKNIKNGGYKTQSELNRIPFRGVYDEVRVTIDATGNIEFFDGGRHRLSIAKMLDIDQIPVRVVVRHTQWQETRELVAKTENTEDLPEKVRSKLDHPDLQNIL